MGCLRPKPKDTDFFWGSWISHLGSYKEVRNSYHHKMLSSISIFQLFHCLHLTGSFNMCITRVFFLHIAFSTRKCHQLTSNFCSENLQVHLCSKPRQVFSFKTKYKYFFFFFFLEPVWSSIPCQTVHQLPAVQFFFAGQLARAVVGLFGIWFGYVQQDLLYLVTSAVLLAEILICSRKNDCPIFKKKIYYSSGADGELLTVA